jgi:hypothetical protein
MRHWLFGKRVFFRVWEDEIVTAILTGITEAAEVAQLAANGLVTARPPSRISSRRYRGKPWRRSLAGWFRGPMVPGEDGKIPIQAAVVHVINRRSAAWPASRMLRTAGT